MPLLTSHVLLLTHSLTTLSVAYFLLTSPSTLLSSSSLWVLGESMHIRPFSHSPLSTKRLSAAYLPSNMAFPPSEPLAMLALVLALSALTQAFFAGGLAPISLSENEREKKVSLAELGEKVFALRFMQNQWMGLAGIRVLLMGGLVGWSYVFHSERNETTTALTRNTSAMGLLSNNVVFTGALLDMLFWGYLWTAIREEGREVANMVARKKADE